MSVTPKLTLPGLAEELDRKTVETLEMLLLKRDQGKITEAQFDTGLDVLFSVASGLVREDFAELISLTENDINREDSSFKQRRLFIKDARTVYISINADSASFTLLKRVNGRWKPAIHQYRDRRVPEKALKEQVTILVKKLVLMGYKEY